ncbi:unnamed protein product [Cuscuta epithymum]|uniref:Transposase, Ptta/En/Spm, plant n=1 Tax=Cuscuta epithymum TaxID=186058 RepID=A0AAV0FV26_9ASTE|nr:unnamed protein product [Cuscuta epithymum]
MFDENECAVPTSTQLILQKTINEVVKKCTRKGPAKELNESRNGELGSMSAYIALKKKKQMIEVRDEGDSIEMHDTIVQQHNAEKGQETPQTSTAENQQEKKCRGPTRMFSVHTRNEEEKKVIDLNEFNQAVANDDKTLSEFSNFLGTLARQCVPLCCVNWHAYPHKEDLWTYVQEKYTISDEGKAWVLKTINDTWRCYKARIKKNHYKKFSTNEERIENRPLEIPKDEFELVMKYWGRKEVQAKAEKNTSNRKKVKDTHTVGPRSFAQIREKLQSKKPNKEKASKAEVFLVTRKRKAGRKYASLNDVTEYKIVSNL